MKIRSSALVTLAVSVMVILIGIVLAVTGMGLKHYSQSFRPADITQMLWAMLAVVILLFVFGFVRYDMPGGLALGVAGLHDQLLTLALTTLASIAFVQSYSMPALVVGSAVFTCCFSVPVLREARLIGKSVSLREHTREEVAGMAVKKTMPVVILVGAVALLIFIAFAVSGNSLMIGFMLPVLAGIVASFLSATRITPYLWAAAASRSRSKR